jgi:ribonucleoside-triphosphate reductase
VSYVEVPDMKNNIPAVLSLIRHIYDHIMYAEINSKSDYCQCCGFTGQIAIEEDENKKLYWRCPNCGNTDQNRMNVARRTCGYIGTNFWNQGRTQEIRDRVLHL